MNNKRLLLLAIGLIGIWILFQASSLINNNDVLEERRISKLDYAWLTGHWKGDGFGGISEEIWAPPADDGTMMGMYRHIKDGKLIFYEFLLLDEDGMRLKHFHPDLKGWETKDKFVSFDMVEHTPDRLSLKGLTFERKDESMMEIRLKMKRNGKLETEVFTMHRVN